MKKINSIFSLAKKTASFFLLFILGYSIAAKGQAAVTVTSDRNPACAGQTVTFTATFNSASNGGNLIFKDGGTQISTVITVPTGAMFVNFSTSTLTLAGSPHAITAEFTATPLPTIISPTFSQTISPLPSAPASPVEGSRCGTGTVILSATVGGGTTIDWYAALTGGSPVASGTGVTTFTTPSISATTTYYAEARNTATNCVSPGRTAVTATVNPVPAVPVAGAGPFARCGTGTVVLTAAVSTGETIDWYAAATGGTPLTGGTGVTSFTTPSISATTTYYAETRNTTTNCVSSARTAVTATVNSIPTAPVAGAGPFTRCGTGTVILTATVGTGETIDWYAAATGGSPLAGGTGVTSFTTPSISTTTIYYAETKTTASGCVSATRTPVTATINPEPAPPVAGAGPFARCGTGTVLLTATVVTGETIDWYAAATGGSPLSGGTGVTSFTTPSIAATTIYYAEARNTTTNCGSVTRTAVTATINPIPATPVAGAGPFTRCGTGTVVLTATVGTGETIDWYAAATGGSPLAGGTGVTSFTTPSISATTTYYAEARTTAGNCISATRTPVIATINLIPAVPVAGAGPFTRCGNGTLVLTATVGTGEVIDWYAAATGGSPLAGGTGVTSFTTPSISATTIYYAEARTTAGNCVSPTRTPVTATINAAPAVPVAGAGPFARCGTGTVVLTATVGTGETIDWYAAATGGSPLAGGTGVTSFTTPSISATTTYYAEARNTTTNCGSVTRTVVTATINPIPAAPVAGAGPFNRCGTGTLVLTATVGTGETIDWYAAATGGSPLAGGTGVTSFTTPSISATTTYYAEARTTSGNCLSATRTPVIATINSIPAVPVAGAGPFTRCGTGTVVLTATVGTGETIDWYAAATGGSPLAGGTGVTSFTTPGISATTTYYAEARTTAGNCVSATRTQVTATVTATPAPPAAGAGPFTRCGTGTLVLTATVGTGEVIDWYAAATGGSPLAGGTGVTSFTTPSISATTIYYAEARTTAGNCVSATRIQVTATVTAIPAVPVAGAGPFARCGTGTVVLTATVGTGETIDWYAAATGGSPLAGGTDVTSFTTPSISATTIYYAEARTTSGNCVSATRTPITATVTAAPAAPVAGAGPFTRCGAGTLTLTATVGTGATIDWYAAATGGSPLAGGTGVTSFTTPSISATTIYYAEARTTAGNCVSATRTQVTATVTATPAPPVAGAGPFARCGTGTVVLTATVGTGETVDWYAAATGGSPLAGGTGVTSFTTPSISATTIYYAEARTTAGNCVSATRTPVTATVTAAPAVPVAGAGPFARCGTGTVVLTATVGTGETIDWYAAATGGSPLAGGTGVASFTTPSISATTIYYAEARTTAGNCVSATRTPVTATVTAAPAAPVAGAGPFTRCGTGTVVLTATVGTGETIDWYAAATGGSPIAGGTGVTSFTTPSISATTIFYAEARTTAGNCVSATRTPVTATVTTTPAVPVAGAGPFTRCGTGTVVLTATVGTGETIDWYAAATGGSPITGGTGVTSFTTPSISTTTIYYAEARTTAGNCVSATRTQVTATVTAAPAAPVAGAGPFTRCGTGTVVLTATVGTGETTDWYAAATGGSPIAGGTGVTSFTTPSISATTIYYAEARTTAGNCVSATRTPVTATVTAAPAVPVAGAGPFTRCGTGTVVLTATVGTGEAIDWYAAATGGSPIAGGTGVTSFTTPSISATTIYYAEARTTAGNCVSATRTPITATVTAAPAVPVAGAGPFTRCGTGTLTLTATVGTGTTIDWYAAATGGSPLAGGTGVTSFTTPSISATTIYYAEARSTAGNCISATRTPVTATITSAPAVPVAGAGPFTRCGTGTVVLTATVGTGETIDWYAAATGGSPLAGGTGVTSFTTPSISTTTTYYAEARSTAGTCVSATRTPVIATVAAPPAAPTVSAAPSATCAGTTGTITVSAPAPAAGITYSIDGSTYTNTTGVFTAAPGTYNVTVRNAAGCTSAATSVTVGPAPTAPAAPTATATPPATCAATTGTITVSAPAPAAGITYSIDGSTYTNTTGIFTAAPGTYNVTVRNAAGCTSAATSVTVGPAPTAPAAPTATATPPATCAATTGTITVSTPAPAAGITYSIDGSTYTNTTGVFPAAPGTYNVTVRNAAGCTSAATSVTVGPAPTAPAAPTVTVTQPTCTVPTGIITVNTPAPATGITYSINGTTYTNTTGVFNGVAPGNYNVTVRNAAGCTSAATSATINPAPTPSVTPTFTQIGPLCQNSTPPILPTTSTNSVTGTWNPATINTATVGTTTYTFTPAAGQCGTTATMNIVISTGVTPTFTQIGPLCQNSTPPALPTSSTNGVSGTWSPATINTATVGTTTYTFTPATGQCGTTTTMNIVITTQVTPTFTQIGPLNQNSTPPALPAASTNNITGTWSPATINTSTAGSTTYTFTPAAGQCATTTTMVIQINSLVTPTFTQIGPLCQNSTPPALPATSTNNITGTWSPATINTASAGTTTYTFTPSTGQGATSATMNIVVTAQVLPVFTQIGPMCQNSTAPALAASSTNNISGTWSPATINTATPGTTTYTFTPAAGQCGTTATMNIVITNGVIPTFTQIGPLCQSSAAPALPASSTNGITGTWNPATISTAAPGTTTYTFTPASGQCGTPATMAIVVTTQVTPGFAQIGPLCQGSSAPSLPTTSTNGLTGTWNPATINTATVGTTTYTFTPAAGQCGATATMAIAVTPQTTPSFTTIGPLCQNSTAPALPATSANGISGTWNPATISTALPGTTTYTFTPAAGQCGTTTTMAVVVLNQGTPSFTQIGPLCQNSTAPALPATSPNGISGTWSPATISTAVPGTTTYTFTPSSSSCGTSTTMNITVTSLVTPTFSQIGPLCQISTPPSLPTVSTNGITGTWNPATINTAVVGTSNYIFTPAAGQCGATATMAVVITTQVIPTFTQIPPLCQNSPPPTLPAVSTNGVTGTWSPATVNTAATGTTTHTFTPAAGQCGTGTTMNVVVTSQVGPTFTAIGPLCLNSTPPALPATSLNGISGTWTPATINTSAVGTSTYTFTQSSGECARGTTLSITINPPVKPTFNAIGPLCQNSTAPSLPITSTNGITGTWSPATISTTTAGTSTYTFTPTASQCAETVSLSITITSQVTPALSQIGPLCQNSVPPTLPATSMNGITGTWSPATISTATIGSSSYTFMPAAGQCGRIVTMIVTIKPLISPLFNPIDALCEGAAAPPLPTSSSNGITGTWNPATISTATPGSNTYRFTPGPGQCATPTTLSVTINPNVAVSFEPIGPFCQGSTAPSLPTISIEGISGTWSPSTINTASIGKTTYTFRPAAGQCGTITTMDIETTSQIVPNFTTIGPFCQNSNPPKLPTVSADGFVGTWSPDTINTSIIGTSVYTFTPNPGQCGTTATVNVMITNQVTPIFNGIGPLCQNSPPPLLPTRSTNGIIGTWSPSTINTSTAGTSNYVFTPTANQCGNKTTMDILITSQFVPTFTDIGPLCQKSTAPLLSSTSNNGIRGTWSPAKVNTDSAGTRTYTFTPTPGQVCAAPALLDITVKPVRSSSTAIAICTNQLPYSWNGQGFTAAGTYNVTLLSSLACDSVATLNLDVKAVLTSTTKVSICPSLLPYTWNGKAYNAAGTYNTTLQNASGCDSIASLVLTVSPTLTSITDVTVCSTELPYTWNGQKYELPGTYSKTLKTPAGCDSIATLQLSLIPIPTAFFSGTDRLCAGSTTTLNLSFSGTGPWAVEYSDGTTSHTIDSITVSPYQLVVSPKVTTTYRITKVSNRGCVNSTINNAFTVNVIQSQPGIRYSTEYAQPNKPKQLQARTLSGNYSYSWIPVVGLNEYSIPNPVFNYDKTTEYTILLRSSIGCLTVDTLLVKVVDEYTGPQAPDLFVPKAWTPNADGRNDLLFPFPAKIRELKYFRVYNRWGQLMFETNQLMKGWNGNYNGKPQAMDSYTWVAEAIGIDGSIIKRSGNSALLR